MRKNKPGSSKRRRARVADAAAFAAHNDTGTRMINDQNIYSSAPGTFGRWGNLADHGCGLIAVHNANQILGYRIPFSKTYRTFQEASAKSTNLGGLIGTNPLYIKNYYKTRGYKVRTYRKASDVRKGHDAYIILYTKGNFLRFTKIPTNAHYMAARYDKGTDKYKVYNGAVPEYSSMEELARERNASSVYVMAVDKP